MVYTELAPRRLQFHVAPAKCERCKYTTVGYLKKEKKKKALLKETRNSHLCERSKSAQESGE